MMGLSNTAPPFPCFSETKFGVGSKEFDVCRKKGKGVQENQVFVENIHVCRKKVAGVERNWRVCLYRKQLVCAERIVKSIENKQKPVILLGHDK